MDLSQPILAIGLMSGTSRDGVDAALLLTDGRERVECRHRLTLPYTGEFRDRLAQTIAGRVPVLEVERELTRLHADAVHALLAESGTPAGTVAVIGFHGHTVLHAPRERLTWQIGNGGMLAELTGIDVVEDFRGRDVAEGGEGAPLAPVYHAALARDLEKPVAVVNVGGVANMTWIGRPGADGESALLAFDTGPGNGLIDDWVLRHTGRHYDAEGALARAGRPDPAVLGLLLSHDYFRRPAPKSLDRDAFDPAPVAALSPADGAATLTHFTAAAVALGARLCPEAPRRWLVTGGGRRNPVLMAAFAEHLRVAVIPVEDVGWDGDALEAQAFAYLAVRSLEGLPISFPSTTGVRAPTSGGRLHRKQQRPL